MARDKKTAGLVKILVAEDNNVTRLILERGFARLGFTKDNVTIVENGLEAVSQIQQGNAFDLVLTDQNMPNMNGDKLIVFLKEAEFQGIIIGMSGEEEGAALSGESAASVMNNAGADAFYVKSDLLKAGGLKAALESHGFACEEVKRQAPSQYSRKRLVCSEGSVQQNMPENRAREHVKPDAPRSYTRQLNSAQKHQSDELSSFILG